MPPADLAAYVSGGVRLDPAVPAQRELIEAFAWYDAKASPGVEVNFEAYGSRIREDILALLPEGWSLEGKRVLDFGCGSGRVLRHFMAEAESGTEVYGCDINKPSIEWLQENLCPPLRVFVNGAPPPLPVDDARYDLIWAHSVFTHITDQWGAWLLELHRVLKKGGLLLATFMGEGGARLFDEDRWEERVGMNVLGLGAPWNQGGPMVLHSRWWIEAHWGRAFEILAVQPDGFAARPGVWQGAVLMRPAAEPPSVDELEAPEPGEPREFESRRHNLRRLEQEGSSIRQALEDQRAEVRRLKTMMQP